MMSEKMLNEINLQIKEEMRSAYIYLAMAAQLRHEGWDGMAHWMEKQYSEEVVHAMKFYGFLNERGERVELEAIEKPQKEWASVLEIFKGALAHEKFITSRIHKMMGVAIEEKDYAAQGLLQWFVDEQVEEEATASKNVETLERIGDATGPLYMFDAQMGKRQ